MPAKFNISRWPCCKEAGVYDNCSAMAAGHPLQSLPDARHTRKASDVEVNSWKLTPTLRCAALVSILIVFSLRTVSAEYRCAHSFREITHAEIVPTQSLVGEINENYTFYCNYNTSAITNPVLFKTYSSELQKFVNMDTRRVNESSISVVINHNESTSYSIYCHDGTNLCRQNIRIGEKPKDIENLECVSYDWTGLNCTFIVPPNHVPVRYNFSYLMMPKPRDVITATYDNGVGVLYWNAKELGTRQRLLLNVTAVNGLGSNSYGHIVDVYDAGEEFEDAPEYEEF